MVLYDRKISDIYDFWVTHGYYDYKKEAEAVARIVGDGNSTFELGIGTGSTAILLAKMGYQVDGVDNSKYMLSILSKKVKKEELDIGFWKQDMRKLRIKKNYDAALSTGGAFIYLSKDNKLFFDSYFSKLSDIRAIFKNVFDILNPEGLFIINVQSHGESLDLKLPKGINYRLDVVNKSLKHSVRIHSFSKAGKVFLKRAWDSYRWRKERIDKLARDVGFRSMGLNKKNNFYIFKKIVQ